MNTTVFFLIAWIPWGDYAVGHDRAFLDHETCLEHRGKAAEMLAEQERSGVVYCVEVESLDINDAFKKLFKRNL